MDVRVYTIGNGISWHSCLGCWSWGRQGEVAKERHRTCWVLCLIHCFTREQDKISGKRTLIVRFGEKAGRYAYLILGILAVGLCTFYAFNGYLMASLLPILFLILHFTTWREMVRIYQGKELNIVLGKTARNIVVFGLLLSIGLIL